MTIEHVYLLEPLALACLFDIGALTMPPYLPEVEVLAEGLEGDLRQLVVAFQKKLEEGRLSEAGVLGKEIAGSIRRGKVPAAPLLIPAGRWGRLPPFFKNFPEVSKSRVIHTSILQDYDAEVFYSGRYRDVEVVHAAKGVYTAFDFGINDWVIVKTLAQDHRSRFMSEEELRLNLRREFEIGIRLHHSHIARMLGWGEDFEREVKGEPESKPQPYLAVEYAGDRSLASLLRQRKFFEWEVIRPILLQLLSALSAIHGAGIVHRDVKPGNIFLIGEEGDYTVKLIDFGLALNVHDQKQVEEESADDRCFYGTPLYMPPEQIKAWGTDHRSDLYAVGVLMFRLLTGGYPVEGSFSFEGFIKAHRLSPRLLREVRPDIAVPESVQAIVAKALLKNRNERFQSAAEMAEAIERCR